MEDGQPAAMDPVAVIRSRPYLFALVLAAVLGIPISVVAYGFLALVTEIQQYLFEDLPQDVFTGGTPAWWPVPWLVLCGLLTGLSIRRTSRATVGTRPPSASTPTADRRPTASCPGCSSPRSPR